jgi:hypothetical protein
LLFVPSATETAVAATAKPDVQCAVLTIHAVLSAVDAGCAWQMPDAQRDGSIPNQLFYEHSVYNAAHSRKRYAASIDAAHIHWSLRCFQLGTGRLQHQFHALGLQRKRNADSAIDVFGVWNATTTTSCWPEAFAASWIPRY